LGIHRDNNYKETDDDEKKVTFQGGTQKLMNVLRESLRERESFFDTKRYSERNFILFFERFIKSKENNHFSFFFPAHGGK
jgi:hypothetical protein